MHNFRTILWIKGKPLTLLWSVRLLLKDQIPENTSTGRHLPNVKTLSNWIAVNNGPHRSKPMAHRTIKESILLGKR